MDFVFTLNGVIKKKLGCKRQVSFSTVHCFFATICLPSLFPCQPFRKYLPLPLPYPSPLCRLSHSGVSRSWRARVRGAAQPQETREEARAKKKIRDCYGIFDLEICRFSCPRGVYMTPGQFLRRREFTPLPSRGSWL